MSSSPSSQIASAMHIMHATAEELLIGLGVQKSTLEVRDGCSSPRKYYAYNHACRKPGSKIRQFDRMCAPRAAERRAV